MLSGILASPSRARIPTAELRIQQSSNTRAQPRREPLAQSAEPPQQPLRMASPAQRGALSPRPSRANPRGPRRGAPMLLPAPAPLLLLLVLLALLLSPPGALARRHKVAAKGATPNYPNPPNANRPPMGFNTWNKFGCGINEGLAQQIAVAMVDEGLLAAGYKFLNLDDCWLSKNRDSQGKLLADPTAFPSGMKSIADYVHGKGLYFGVYLDSGSRTCASRAGSFRHEDKDAASLASWGVDYLKMDNCGAPSGTGPQVRYGNMSKYLQQSGRRIIFSLCNWGQSQPAKWGRSIGADLWRTTLDISNDWGSFMSIAGKTNQWASYAGPKTVGGVTTYAWNDPDMLEVGNGMQANEDRVHFSLWSAIKAPLLIGCDIRSMSAATKAILTNTEVIAINQDSLGAQATRVQNQNAYEVWSGPLSGDRQVVLIIVKSGSQQTVTINTKTLLGLPWVNQPFGVRDVWKQTTTTTSNFIVTVPNIPYHDCALLVLSKI